MEQQHGARRERSPDAEQLAPPAKRPALPADLVDNRQLLPAEMQQPIAGMMNPTDVAAGTRVCMCVHSETVVGTLPCNRWHVVHLRTV